VHKVALGQIFLRFSPVGIISPELLTHISPGGRTIDPLVAEVQRHRLTPSGKKDAMYIHVYVRDFGKGKCKFRDKWT
jgi:hypothetical protein